MKKKWFNDWGNKSPIQKWLRIMKLTFLILLVSMLHLSASVYSQQTKLNVSLQNATVREVLRTIEDQSEFFFLYTNEDIDINRKVNVDLRDKSIENVLENLFKGTDVVYKIADRQVVLMNSNLDARLSQQQKEVTGKVTDSAGAPLPGVTVVVKGTTNGTITDFDGKYFLPNVPGNATLQFSFVGMKAQEVTVEGKSTINISLAEETIGIEEVVAIGYGTIKKSDLTGSVSSVQSEILSHRSETQTSQALQGLVPGLMVTRTNNSPGSAATIRIRGITTIGDNNPLIIRDGVPIDDINSINPNDIESISVLKDAASASIYGARAASGVILVTTKRANSGDLNLNYNIEYGFEKPTEMADYVGAIRYMEMMNEWGWNDNNNTGNEYPSFTKDIIDNYVSLNAENSDLYPITNWADVMLKDNAPKQSHVLSFSAGTAAIQSKGSLAYDKIDGLYMKRSFERMTVNINNDIVVNKFFGATFDMYAQRIIDKNPIMSPMFHTRITPPIYAAYWSDERSAQAKSGDNIYGVLKEGGFDDLWRNSLGGKLSLNFTPIDGLKLSAIVSGSLGADKRKTFQILSPYYAWDDPSRLVGYLHMGSQHQGNQSTRLNENRSDNYRWTTQFLANYVKSFGDHDFNATLGNENFQSFNEDLSASRDQYTLTSYPYLNLGPLDYRGNSGSAYENAYLSYFGRLMYNYKNKYLLQGNIRYDASSRFHPDYRWASFPSVSVGWVISEESFMKNIAPISFLKIRASWGKLGNERIGNYPYQATIAFGSALFYKGNSAVSTQTASQNKYAIKDISWETTESYNFGIDANLLDNRLRFTGDLYKKNTMDMLLALEIPDYIGLANPDQNTGKMYTKGWELELGWTDNINEFNYSISVNLSDFESVMGDLGGTEFLGNQIKIEGSEFNEWYGYISDGIFQTQEEVNNSAKTSNSVKPGDVKYKDISGPDGEPDGIISPTYDRTLLGGSLPRYLFGGNVLMEYKNFDLSFIFQGVGKQNVKYDVMMVQPFIERWGNVPAIIDGNYWSVYNTAEQNLKAKYPRLSIIGESNNYTPMSDFWLFNGAYFRVKNITLGYNVPNSIIERINCKGLRIYASLSDILSFNNYPKGWDPELSGTGYPITASIFFGASVKF